MKYIRTNFVYNPSPNRHVHEIQGSVEAIKLLKIPHSHNIVAVSDEAISIGLQGHIHEVKFKTDYCEGHYHEFSGRTTGSILIKDSHVHFLESETTKNEGHKHKFRLVTLLEKPIIE